MCYSTVDLLLRDHSEVCQVWSLKGLFTLEGIFAMDSNLYVAGSELLHTQKILSKGVVSPERDIYCT